MTLGIIYKDGAVFQRGKPLYVCGEGAGELAVSFLGKDYRFRLGEEKWSVSLGIFSAGGPYEMKFSLDGEQYLIHDVYVGDVFLCAGQSNMEIVLRKCYHDKGDMRDREDLRLFELQTTTTEFAWKNATVENAMEMSAVAYYFGAYASREGVCVGLVSCNRGATCIESWIDRDLLREKGMFTSERDREEAGLLYYPYNRCGELHSMLFSRLCSFSFAACIFYQGESNASHPHDPPYDKLFCLLVDSWREQLRDEKLHFITTELCDFGEYNNGKVNFAEVREYQRKVIKDGAVEGVSYITTTDLGEIDDIHPRRKKQIAERMYLAYRANVLGEGCEWCGPFAEECKIDGKVAIILFSHSSGLRAEGKIKSLELVGEDGERITEYKCEIVEQTLVISAAENIAHVSLFYRNNPMTNLFNGAGFPATGFKK